MLRPPDREERGSPGAAAQRVAHSLTHAHTFMAAGRAPTPLGNVGQVTTWRTGPPSGAGNRVNQRVSLASELRATTARPASRRATGTRNGEQET
jgi:hypothetical protein